jgi:hypothetical protein
VKTRRRFAWLLGLALTSSAAAQSQVRVVPAEAGLPPLAGAGVSAAFPAPQATALFMPSASALIGSPVFEASASPSAAAPSAAPAAAPAVQRAFAAAFAAPVSAPALAFPAPSQAPTAAPLETAKTSPSVLSAGDGRSARPAALLRTAAAPRSDLGALFDGSAALPALPAAEEGPEPRLETRGPALSPRTVRRAQRAFSIGVPLAAAGTIALGVVSPHLAMAVLHGVGQASYWLSNPLAFFFTIPQIYRILSRRSAEISLAMTAVGLVSALATTLCFAFDGKDFMMYRNLAQTAGFAAMLGLEVKYGRGAKGPAPSRPRALAETGAVVLALTAILIASGPLLMSIVPSVALMSSLLVPFQILSGFGFTYMMYAQLKKMSLEQSAGDSSAGMMWAYLGTKVIWVWSFATLLSLVAAPAWLTLAAGAAFAGVSWIATRALLTHLLSTPWSFLPEKISLRGRTLTRRTLGDAAAFVALAALILILSGVGHLAFASLLGIKAGASSLFAMYLLYTVQNLVAALATSKTLKLHAAFGHKARHAGS